MRLCPARESGEPENGRMPPLESVQKITGKITIVKKTKKKYMNFGIKLKSL